jgi:hypothetical protein
MFQVFRQNQFQPPHHGDGMWPPLTYGIDILGILAGLSLLISLVVIAFLIVPIIAHHQPQRLSGPYGDVPIAQSHRN